MAEILELDSTDPQITLDLGARLGRMLQAGDIVGLVGQLGAGKTWFAKGLADGLDVERHEYVNSPAYDIIHEYPGRVPVYHMDFYRMEEIGDEEYLWLDEYIEKRDGVTIAEWSDKFLASLADEYLRIEISRDPDSEVRCIRLAGIGAHYAGIVSRLQGVLDADS